MYSASTCTSSLNAKPTKGLELSDEESIKIFSSELKKKNMKHV